MGFLLKEPIYKIYPIKEPIFYPAGNTPNGLGNEQRLNFVLNMF